MHELVTRLILIYRSMHDPKPENARYLSLKHRHRLLALVKFYEHGERSHIFASPLDVSGNESDTSNVLRHYTPENF